LAILVGHAWVRAKIGDVEGRKVVEVDALVDTGATLTVVPRKLAEELGLRPTGGHSCNRRRRRRA